MTSLSTLIEAQLKYGQNAHMQYLGAEMFRMYTEMGFPPDMFLEGLSKQQELDLLAKVFIVSEYHSAFLEHRRASGINEERVDKIRRKNREDMERLINTGELGAY